MLGAFDIMLKTYGSSILIDADVRLARRIRRDTVERGRDINSVLEMVSLISCLCCH